ncbi:MAG: hypothetical protein DI584_12425 [Stenotrophomonas sp.]|jgi:hypothetical protein|nr:MAG: hypothetical protein DI584_12425 [Stenotrophomonas sp.]
MMAAPAPLSPAAANALSAFLRGVERRALVVAELQAGDAAVGERAVAVAMRAFAGHAAQLLMVEWPARFWGLLCSTPQLLKPTSPGNWEPAFAHLGTLAAGERLALLLRIGAGLDETAASTVLGVDANAYRQALAGACPVDADGHPDAASWRALAEQVQALIRDLSPPRLQQLEQLRDSVITGALPAAAAPTAAGNSPRVEEERRRKPAPRRKPAKPWTLRTWLLLCLPLLLLAVVALWWWRSHTVVSTDPDAGNGLIDNGPVQVESLPDDSPPAGLGEDPHAAADAAMLADPALDTARDADFHAWYAAGGPIPVDESQPQPSRPEPAGAALETADADE